MNILINGIGGAMGQTLLTCLKSRDDVRAVGGIDAFADPKRFYLPVFKTPAEVNIPFDCIIDFSVKDAVYGLLDFAVAKNVPVVLATTGYGESEMKCVEEAAKKIPLFRSGNMSVGINLLIKLVKEAAAYLGEKADVEIIEEHHNLKVDAPSGTALMLADAVKSVNSDLQNVNGRSGIVGKRKKTELGIHSVRGGTIVGKHEVMFIMNNEIVSLKHEAQSKTMFAFGAIDAAIFLKGKPAGLYNMQDMMK